jgi:hypothetical protein
MTATVIPFPVAKRRIRGLVTRTHQARTPGELSSRRLYLTRKSTWKRAACDRAYRLYLEGAPCWSHPHCLDRTGHAGACTLPKERGQ